MSEETDTFYVYVDPIKGSNYPSFVPAKYLIGPTTGKPVKDPNWSKRFFGDNGKISFVDQSNVYYSLYDAHGNRLDNDMQNNHGYYIVPADYDPATQLASSEGRCE
jgi:hypothetical protein